MQTEDNEITFETCNVICLSNMLITNDCWSNNYVNFVATKYFNSVFTACFENCISIEFFEMNFKNCILTISPCSVQCFDKFFVILLQFTIKYKSSLLGWQYLCNKLSIYNRIRLLLEQHTLIRCFLRQSGIMIYVTFFGEINYAKT